MISPLSIFFVIILCLDYHGFYFEPLRDYISVSDATPNLSTGTSIFEKAFSVTFRLIEK